MYLPSQITPWRRQQERPPGLYMHFLHDLTLINSIFSLLLINTDYILTVKPNDVKYSESVSLTDTRQKQTANRYAELINPTQCLHEEARN